MGGITNSHASLKLDRDRFVAFAFAHADILIELDGEGRIVFADGATPTYLGRSPDTMRGKLLSEFIRREDRDRFQKIINPADGKIKFENVKLYLKGSNLDVTAFAVSGYAIPYMRNHIFLTLSRVKHGVAQAELATHDAKTGLLNQDAFAWQVINISAQFIESGNELYMTLLDVSGLINKLEGNEDIIEAICARIKSCSVDADSAGIIEEGRIAVIHAKSVTPEEIATGVKDACGLKGDETNLVVETVKLDIPSLTEADAARAVIYTLNGFRAKGKHPASHLGRSYRLMLGDTIRKINEFKRVCLEKDFDVAYQPIVDLKTKAVHHYEGLVRLRQNLFLNPYDFITFGEQAGFVPEFDLAMCRKSFETMQDLDKERGAPMLSINLSGISIASDIFREALIELIKKHIILNGKILFEITESARIENLESSNHFIQELRKLGNKCCIDDFGAGESSFDYIRIIDVDFVKIDGSYVNDCGSNERSRHLLKAMVGVCRDMGIDPIAEMVEDKKSSDMLLSLGITYGQGYYFGKPTTDTRTLKPAMLDDSLPRKAAISTRKFSTSGSPWWAKK